MNTERRTPFVLVCWAVFWVSQVSHVGLASTYAVCSVQFVTLPCSLLVIKNWFEETKTNAHKEIQLVVYRHTCFHSIQIQNKPWIL